MPSVCQFSYIDAKTGKSIIIGHHTKPSQMFDSFRLHYMDHLTYDIRIGMRDLFIKTRPMFDKNDNIIWENLTPGLVFDDLRNTIKPGQKFSSKQFHQFLINNSKKHRKSLYDMLEYIEDIVFTFKNKISINGMSEFQMDMLEPFDD